MHLQFIDYSMPFLINALFKAQNLYYNLRIEFHSLPYNFNRLLDSSCEQVNKMNKFLQKWSFFWRIKNPTPPLTCALLTDEALLHRTVAVVPRACEVLAAPYDLYAFLAFVEVVWLTRVEVCLIALKMT